MVTYDLWAIAALAVLLLCVQRAAGTALVFRGTRVITCPETGQAAAVGLSLWPAALSSLFRKPVLRVEKCSRWPEARSCDHGCVKQIGSSPSGTLASSIVARWCRGKSCVCCGVPLARVHVTGRRPYLLTDERKFLGWKDIPPQNLPKVLETSGPVCWTCLMAETHTW